VKCWNFCKAEWSRFCLLTWESIERLPPRDTTNIEKAYKKLCESLLFTAKQCIPRGRHKNYVPCWDKECKTLYRSFLRAQVGTDSERAASSLLSRLDQRRQEQWEEALKSIDFSHSTGKAWSIISKLTGRSGHSTCLRPVSANSIASQLVKNGAHEIGLQAKILAHFLKNRREIYSVQGRC